MSGYLILILFLGLIFGSLGSVLMTRFSDGVTRTKLRGFLFGRSQCPSCKHRLHIQDLIPLVSYLVQSGECRYCKKKIPRIYPVSELLCGGIFVMTYFLLKDFGTSILVFGLLTNRLLVLLLIYDLQKYELHMIVWILLMAVGILANIFVSGGNLQDAFLSTLLFGGAFIIIYFFGKRYAKRRFNQEEGFGEGDVYLAGAIGIFIPIVLSFHNLLFSPMMLANVLILFIILSSIIGLIWAGLQYIGNLKFIIGNLKFGHISTMFENSKFKIHLSSNEGNSKFKVIPFFPPMIIAFRLISWKLSFFISFLFPLAG